MKVIILIKTYWMKVVKVVISVFLNFGIKRAGLLKLAPIFPFSSSVMDVLNESSFLVTLISMGVLGFQFSKFVIIWSPFKSMALSAGLPGSMAIIV